MRARGAGAACGKAQLEQANAGLVAAVGVVNRLEPIEQLAVAVEIAGAKQALRARRKLDYKRSAAVGTRRDGRRGLVAVAGSVVACRGRGGGASGHLHAWSSTAAGDI